MTDPVLGVPVLLSLQFLSIAPVPLLEGHRVDALLRAHDSVGLVKGLATELGLVPSSHLTRCPRHRAWGRCVLALTSIGRHGSDS